MFIIWNQHFLWHITFIFWSFFSAKNYKSWYFFPIIHISIKFLVPMGIIKCNLKRKTSFGYSRRNFLCCYLRRIVARVCIGKITLTHHLSRFEFCLSLYLLITFQVKLGMYEFCIEKNIYARVIIPTMYIPNRLIFFYTDSMKNSIAVVL